VQRQIGRLASVSAGYVHTSGKNMPILLNFAQRLRSSDQGPA
jgi:hypothetical protein